MSVTVDLKNVERKVWMSFFQDGLWDIYLGLLLAVMGVSALLTDLGLPESQSMPVFIGLEVAAMLSLWAGKRYITRPRMGRVKAGPKAKARKRKARLLLTLSVLVGIVAFAISAASFQGRFDLFSPVIFIPVIWAANMLLVFGLGAYFLDFNRLYVIAVLYAIPMPLDMWLREFAGIRLGWIAFVVPASVIVVMGTVVFVRFLRDYPPLAQTAVAGDE